MIFYSDVSWLELNPTDFENDLKSKFGDFQAFPNDLQQFLAEESPAVPKFTNGISRKKPKNSGNESGTRDGIDFNPEEFQASMKKLLNFTFDEAASSGSEMGSYEDEMSFREEGNFKNFLRNFLRFYEKN